VCKELEVDRGLEWRCAAPMMCVDGVGEALHLCKAGSIDISSLSTTKGEPEMDDLK